MCQLTDRGDAAFCTIIVFLEKNTEPPEGQEVANRSLLPILLQVFIQGHKNLNRAINDDIVAVAMLPESEWSCPSSVVLEETEEKTDDADIEVEVCLLYSNYHPESLDTLTDYKFQ